MLRSKIDQQPETALAQAELREELFAMSALLIFDGFQFNDGGVLDDEVGAEAFIKCHAAIMDRDRNLALHPQTGVAQMVREQDFINCFQQTGSDRKSVV